MPKTKKTEKVGLETWQGEVGHSIEKVKQEEVRQRKDLKLGEGATQIIWE